VEKALRKAARTQRGLRFDQIGQKNIKIFIFNINIELGGILLAIPKNTSPTVNFYSSVGAELLGMWTGPRNRNLALRVTQPFSSNTLLAYRRSQALANRFPAGRLSENTALHREGRVFLPLRARFSRIE
jgi:hypothetical protein